MLNAASKNSNVYPAKATPAAGASIATKSTSANMPARSFFDTNVLIYADDKASPAKQLRALNLIAEHRRARTGVVSLQVLQEYFVAATRKLRLDAAIARRKVELLSEFDVAIPEVADVLAAIDLHRLHAFSFWDALVIRSAKQTGCSVLFSEDFQAGREIDGLQIVNPFENRKEQ
jgi:predicted nucleic acid-binding protein